MCVQNVCWWIVWTYLRVQLHDVSHFVPAKAHEAAVVLGAVPAHHDVRLKVGLPLHSVGRGGRSPLGEVGGLFFPKLNKILIQSLDVQFHTLSL